ncbi:hypothetical protein P153DRAFT_258855, partial [Dothidotthia symphoricarpi CBS 119687]
IPEAPPASSPWHSNGQSWSPLAIIGIVAAVVFLLMCIPIIALLLRRFESRRCREMPKPTHGFESKEGSVKDSESWKSILVTREMQRVSLKLTKLEEVHLQGRGWTKAEVRGGE